MAQDLQQSEVDFLIRQNSQLYEHMGAFESRIRELSAALAVSKCDLEDTHLSNANISSDMKLFETLIPTNKHELAAEIEYVGAAGRRNGQNSVRHSELHERNSVKVNLWGILNDKKSGLIYNIDSLASEKEKLLVDVHASATNRKSARDRFDLMVDRLDDIVGQQVSMQLSITSDISILRSSISAHLVQLADLTAENTGLVSRKFILESSLKEIEDRRNKLIDVLQELNIEVATMDECRESSIKTLSLMNSALSESDLELATSLELVSERKKELQFAIKQLSDTQRQAESFRVRNIAIKDQLCDAKVDAKKLEVENLALLKKLEQTKSSTNILSDRMNILSNDLKRLSAETDCRPHENGKKQIEFLDISEMVAKLHKKLETCVVDMKNIPSSEIKAMHSRLTQQYVKGADDATAIIQNNNDLEMAIVELEDKLRNANHSIHADRCKVFELQNACLSMTKHHSRARRLNSKTKRSPILVDSDECRHLLDKFEINEALRRAQGDLSPFQTLVETIGILAKHLESDTAAEHVLERSLRNTSKEAADLRTSVACLTIQKEETLISGRDLFLQFIAGIVDVSLDEPVYLRFPFLYIGSMQLMHIESSIESLSKTSDIVGLDFSENCITDESVKILNGIVTEFHSLKVLDVKENRLSTASLMRLANTASTLLGITSIVYPNSMGQARMDTLACPNDAGVIIHAMSGKLVRLTIYGSDRAVGT